MKFEPTIEFDEEEYCETPVSDETLAIAVNLFDVHFKDKLLIPKEPDG